MKATNIATIQPVDLHPYDSVLQIRVSDNQWDDYVTIKDLNDAQYAYRTVKSNPFYRVKFSKCGNTVFYYYTDVDF